MHLAMPWRIPVVQATLGSCDSPTLAAAVSEAGGFGTLSMHAPTQEQAQDRLDVLLKYTEKPVLLAFTGPWECEEILDVCLNAGHRHFQVFWWNAPRLVARIKAAGALAYQQVGTMTQATDALERQVDALIAQGTQAGGPVRSPIPLRELVPALRAKFSGPIIAGGGLATRDDVAEVLTLGADAAMLGTRFLLSQESCAPVEHKNALARACSTELLLDTRLIGDWPCAPRRRLPLQDCADTLTSLQSGLGLDHINDIRPAAELVQLLNPY